MPIRRRRAAVAAPESHRPVGGAFVCSGEAPQRRAAAVEESMITETTVSATPAAPAPRARVRLLLRGRGARRSVASVLCGRPRPGRPRRRAAPPRMRSSRRRSPCSASWRRSRPIFAYPGTRLLSAIEQALAERNAGVCVRLVQHLSTALLTGAYRYDLVGLGSAAGRRGQQRGAAAAGHAGRQRPQTLLRDARRHAGGPVAVGARAARPEAAAAHRRRLRLRGRAGRHVRGRGASPPSATTTCRPSSSATDSSTAHATTCRCCASS